MFGRCLQAVREAATHYVLTRPISVTIGVGTETGIDSRQQSVSRSPIRWIPSPLEELLIFSLLRDYAVVLYETERVYAIGVFGQQHLARALCDSSSQSSFVTSRLAQRSLLRRRYMDLDVVGFGTTPLVRSFGLVNLTLRSLYSEFTLSLEAVVQVTITLEFLAVQLDQLRWLHLQGIQVTDPIFGASAVVNVLHGVDVHGLVVESGLRSCQSDESCAKAARINGFYIRMSILMLVIRRRNITVLAYL